MNALLIMQTAPRRSRRALAALLAVLLLACSQGDGEPCQENRDCEDGLICLPARDSDRSVCGTPDEVDAGGGAAGSGDPELPPDDAGTSDAGSSDAGAGDAGDPSDQDAGDDPADLDAG